TSDRKLLSIFYCWLGSLWHGNHYCYISFSYLRILKYQGDRFNGSNAVCFCHRNGRRRCYFNNSSRCATGGRSVERATTFSEQHNGICSNYLYCSYCTLGICWL